MWDEGNAAADHRELRKWLGHGQQIGECIGTGAYGKVYKGMNCSTGTYVAIKEVITTNAPKDQVTSIQKEINLLMKLNHPNIVKYIGISELDRRIDSIYSENNLHIVLEYVENGSLSETIKRFSPLSEPILAIYMKQVRVLSKC